MDYEYNEDEEFDYFHELSESKQKSTIKILKEIRTRDTKQAPGLDIHEMGGVRMGNDPKTSLLNKWNQMHHCKNVFVTDGSCMTSTATQNPSLTFMAISARAANHAIKLLKTKEI